MRNFILKSLVFTVVVIICCISFWALVCSNRDQTLKLPNNCNIVFLGNSHIECAINDTIVKNSFNFARSAECMEYVYCKVKLLSRYNPQLDTIIIGCDNTLLTFKSSSSNLYSPYYYDTYNLNDINVILKNDSIEYIEGHIAQPFNWLKLVNILPTFFYSNIDAHNLTDLGGYLYLQRDKLDEAIKRQNNNIKKIQQSDANSAHFLKKIEQFCKCNNITLIFLHTPMHSALNNDTFYKKFYKENYSNIKFYDFKDFHLPDSCYGDLDHLNYKGAKIFSEYLEKEVFHKNNYPQ